MKSDQFIFAALMSFILFVIFIIQILMPKLTRKDIFFGVRIPEEQIENSELKSVFVNYVKRNIIVFLLFILLNFCFAYILSDYIDIIEISSVLLYILISFIVYYFSNKEVKLIKNKNTWFKGKREVVMINTDFSKNRRNEVLVSSKWFLICLIIIVFNIVIGFKYYGSLPSKVPTHFDFYGNPNGWMNKSYKVIWLMPITEIFMTVIMFFTYKIIAWSKQQINPSSPEESQKKDKMFRHVWSKYIIISSVVLDLLFTFGNLSIFNVVKVNSSYTFIITILITVFILIFTIYLSIKAGQGGSRIKLKNNFEKINYEFSSVDDDRYWKLGNTIYVNKNDPAIFVEKRFGVGWTMNFGRKESIIITIVFIFLIILIGVFAQ